jgi:hypothetical protein
MQPTFYKYHLHILHQHAAELEDKLPDRGSEKREWQENRNAGGENSEGKEKEMRKGMAKAKVTSLPDQLRRFLYM